MATFKFELVSPERLVLSADVDQVDLPGTEGDFGVLAGHAPFISMLKTGVIRVRIAGAAPALAIYAVVQLAGGSSSTSPTTSTTASSVRARCSPIAPSPAMPTVSACAIIPSGPCAVPLPRRAGRPKGGARGRSAG